MRVKRKKMPAYWFAVQNVKYLPVLRVFNTGLQVLVCIYTLFLKIIFPNVSFKTLDSFGINTTVSLFIEGNEI